MNQKEIEKEIKEWFKKHNDNEPHSIDMLWELRDEASGLLENVLNLWTSQSK